MLLLLMFTLRLDSLLYLCVDGGRLPRTLGLRQVPVQAARCREATLGGDRGPEPVDEQARLNKNQLF